MRILCAMAAEQGARALVDVTRAHIDGCLYASPANLTFAEHMAELGARVRIPTTMNAISVERARWRAQGVPPSFGEPAARLAEAYVRMGCRPTCTCAPYLLDGAPEAGEFVGWAESNAVIFANSVLGARTAKHPDFLDLCIALTGRAPLAGVYLDEGRKARRILDVERPEGADESFWPLVGYVAGRLSPDRIPLLRGLGQAAPSRDDLKALCAAFGVTSAAPMLHIEGVTPEAENAAAPDADRAAISRADLAEAWALLNQGPQDIELVAIGSPHASIEECRALADALGGPKGEGGRRRHRDGGRRRDRRRPARGFAGATGGLRRQGAVRDMLVHDHGAGVSAGHANADDQFRQIRALRPGAFGTRGPLRRPRRLRRRGPDGKGAERPSPLAFLTRMQEKPSHSPSRPFRRPSP